MLWVNIISDKQILLLVWTSTQNLIPSQKWPSWVYSSLALNRGKKSGAGSTASSGCLPWHHQDCQAWTSLTSHTIWRWDQLHVYNFTFTYFPKKELPFFSFTFQLRIHPSNACCSMYLTQPIIVGNVPLVDNFHLFATQPKKQQQGREFEQDEEHHHAQLYPDMRKLNSQHTSYPLTQNWCFSLPFVHALKTSHDFPGSLWRQGPAQAQICHVPLQIIVIVYWCFSKRAIKFGWYLFPERLDRIQFLNRSRKLRLTLTLNGRPGSNLRECMMIDDDSLSLSVLMAL